MVGELSRLERARYETLIELVRLVQLSAMTDGPSGLDGRVKNN